MPEPAPLDPHAILTGLGITDAQAAERVTGGSDTAIWRVLWQDAPYALRVFRPEQVAVAEREACMMQLAGEHGIPVPALIRKGRWEARPVLLLTWIKGATLSAALGAHPTQVWQLGKAFGRMQAAIHKIPAPADLDANAWIEWAGDEPELKQRLYDLPSRKNQLLHLDYHPLNVMVDSDAASGVLDWANARAGDPRADFARTYSILRIERYSPAGDSLFLSIGRRLLARAWRNGYLQGGGQLDEMALFYAWAGAAMIRDLSPKIGRPGVWLQSQHLDGVRQWLDMWKWKAGIP